MSTNKKKQRVDNNDLNKAFTALAVLAVLLETIFIIATYFSAEKQVKTEGRAYLEETIATIQSELNRGYSTSELLKDLYTVHGDMFLKDFNRICNELTKDNLAIGSMYFAPDGVIKYSYPQAVDSVTANYNMLLDPIQGPKAQKAINDAKATVAGPHNLIEGGEGFIIRNPIFKNNKFFGFTIVVIDKEQMLNQVTKRLHSADYNFAVWKSLDPTAVLDEDGYIVKKMDGTKKIKRDVYQSFEILNDTWFITLEPVGGWKVWPAMRKSVLISLFLFAILMFLFYMNVLALSRKRQLEMEKFANSAKSTFLFSMSHDIRTPMNAIIGFADLMKKNIDNKEKVLEYLNKLHASSDFLLSLINNVLEMARIESGKIVLEDNVISTQKFEDVTDAVFADMAKNKGLTYSNEYHLIHEYVVGDEMKIRELTLNIISNAIKYTPTGGFVKLSLLESECEKPGYTLFTAISEDSGIGISKEYLPHIYEEFSREKSTTDSQIAGSGLGMPIVKKLIDLMDGSIDIESEVGKGTKITIKLPLKIATAEQIKNARLFEAQDSGKSVADPENKTISFKNKRILLAEDNDLNAEIAIAILEEMGFIVERVADGEICINRLNGCADDFYDLILMDIQMPQMNGYEATKAIRSMENLRKAKIPIIAMTANAFDEDRRKALEAGMNDHVTKPISIADLSKAIYKVLR